MKEVKKGRNPQTHSKPCSAKDVVAYQLRLGSSWFDFFGTPGYHPWKPFKWWFVFDAYAPKAFDIGSERFKNSVL